MMKSTSKHIAMRTCAACGEVKPKRELVRLVRLESGWVEVDIDGKKKWQGCLFMPVRGMLGKRIKAWTTGPCFTHDHYPRQ